MRTAAGRLNLYRIALLCLMCTGLWFLAGRVGLLHVLDVYLRFVSGDPPPHEDVGAAVWLPFVCATVVLQVMLLVPLAELLRHLIGAPPSEVKERLAIPRFRSSALTVAVTFLCCVVAALFVSAFAGVAEEFVFRFLPLAWWDVSNPGERGIFYACLFASNIVFALAHIRRNSDPRWKRVLRTFPQFVMGFWDALVFVKYGLFAAMFGHFLYDVVVILARCPFIIAEALQTPPD